MSKAKSRYVKLSLYLTFGIIVYGLIFWLGFYKKASKGDYPLLLLLTSCGYFVPSLISIVLIKKNFNKAILGLGLLFLINVMAYLIDYSAIILIVVYLFPYCLMICLATKTIGDVPRFPTKTLKKNQ